MTFLYPLALAVGALVAIPITIHLLRRHTDRRVPFPALRYLQRAERKHARSLRVRDLLLLLVRVGGGDYPLPVPPHGAERGR